MKNEMLSLFTAIEENRQFTGYYKKLTIPPIERGSEGVKYKAGDLVSSSSSSPLRFENATVKSSYNENGFIYYVLQVGKGEFIARTKDLRGN